MLVEMIKEWPSKWRAILDLEIRRFNIVHISIPNSEIQMQYSYQNLLKDFTKAYNGVLKFMITTGPSVFTTILKKKKKVKGFIHIRLHI